MLIVCGWLVIIHAFYVKNCRVDLMMMIIVNTTTLFDHYDNAVNVLSKYKFNNYSVQPIFLSFWQDTEQLWKKSFFPFKNDEVR